MNSNTSNVEKRAPADRINEGPRKKSKKQQMNTIKRIIGQTADTLLKAIQTDLAQYHQATMKAIKELQEEQGSNKAKARPPSVLLLEDLDAKTKAIALDRPVHSNWIYPKPDVSNGKHGTTAAKNELAIIMANNNRDKDSIDKAIKELDSLARQESQVLADSYKNEGCELPGWGKIPNQAINDICIVATAKMIARCPALEIIWDCEDYWPTKMLIQTKYTQRASHKNTDIKKSKEDRKKWQAEKDAEEEAKKKKEASSQQEKFSSSQVASPSSSTQVPLQSSSSSQVPLQSSSSSQVPSQSSSSSQVPSQSSSSQVDFPKLPPRPVASPSPRPVASPSPSSQSSSSSSSSSSYEDDTLYTDEEEESTSSSNVEGIRKKISPRIISRH